MGSEEVVVEKTPRFGASEEGTEIGLCAHLGQPSAVHLPHTFRHTIPLRDNSII